MSNSERHNANIEQIKQGNEAAFEDLFKTHYGNLCRFAWRYVKSQAISEELVQEVFTKIWENRSILNPNGSIRAYLYQSVKHLALDHIKHKNISYEYDQEWMAKKKNSKIVIQDEEHERYLEQNVQRAIENLPKRSRMVYKLHRHDGLTYKEIAQVMDISIKTVESQMSRALSKLKDELSPYFSLLVTLASFLILRIFI